MLLVQGNSLKQIDDLLKIRGAWKQGVKLKEVKG